MLLTFFLQTLECKICNDGFALQGERVPRLLACGHSVCHSCLSNIPLDGSHICCPFDRTPTEIGDSGMVFKKKFLLQIFQSSWWLSNLNYEFNEELYYKIIIAMLKQVDCWKCLCGQTVWLKILWKEAF